MKLFFKSLFKKENLLYTIVFFCSLCAIIINRALNGFNNILWISDIGTIAGILCAIFMSKHYCLVAYCCNIVFVAIIITTSIYQKLYMTIFNWGIIYVPFLIFGIIRWIKNKNVHDEKNLNSLSKKSKIILATCSLVILPVICFVLYKLKSNLFYLDAIVSGCSIIAGVLSTFALIDQFYYYVISDFFGIVMYIILSIQNTNNISYIFLQTACCLISTAGLVHWIKLIRKSKQNK